MSILCVTPSLRASVVNKAPNPPQSHGDTELHRVTALMRQFASKWHSGPLEEKDELESVVICARWNC